MSQTQVPLLWAAVSLVAALLSTPLSTLSDRLGRTRVLAADFASSERRGTAFGWFNLAAGILLLPASLVFGWLYQSVSPLAAFGFSSLCAGLAAVLMVAWVRTGSSEGERRPGLAAPGNFRAG